MDPVKYSDPYLDALYMTPLGYDEIKFIEGDFHLDFSAENWNYTVEFVKTQIKQQFKEQHFDEPALPASCNEKQ